MPAVVLLGLFNGMFAVAAIGSMMALAGQGRDRREGTRMGLWGAAQAIAAGFGGLIGAAAADVMRTSSDDATAFGAVFLAEAALFLAAAAHGAPHHGPRTRAVRPATRSGRMTMNYDVVVVGGGPSGATAAEDLARAGQARSPSSTGRAGSSPAAVRSRRA